MGFVGNYAPCGLSPQTDGMPVILQKACGNLIPQALQGVVASFQILILMILEAHRLHCDFCLLERFFTFDQAVPVLKALVDIE